MGSAALGIRRISRKSRSGGEFSAGTAAAPADEPWALARDDCVAVARPVDADAVSGSGDAELAAVSLFRRFPGRARGRGAQRTCGVSDAVPKRRSPRSRTTARQPVGPFDVRAVPTGLART